MSHPSLIFTPPNSSTVTFIAEPDGIWIITNRGNDDIHSDSCFVHFYDFKVACLSTMNLTKAVRKTLEKSGVNDDDQFYIGPYKNTQFSSKERISNFTCSEGKASKNGKYTLYIIFTFKNRMTCLLSLNYCATFKDGTLLLSSISQLPERKFKYN